MRADVGRSPVTVRTVWRFAADSHSRGLEFWRIANLQWLDNLLTSRCRAKQQAPWGVLQITQQVAISLPSISSAHNRARLLKFHEVPYRL